MRAARRPAASFSTGAVLDRIAECAVAATLLILPIAWGGTQAWSQEIAAVLIWLAAACVSVRWVVQPQRPLRACTFWLPILLFVGLVAFQLLPLPGWLIGVISPATLRIKSQLLADAPQSAAFLHTTTISFYCWATATQLRLVLLVSLLFLLVLNLFQDPARIRWLLTVMTLSGLLVAGFAGYQLLFRPKSDYLLMVAPHPNSGPFMNHSHFAQFMNLATGAALGLLLTELAHLSHRHRSTTALLIDLFQWRRWPFWLAALLCVVGPITLFFSMSRGGMLAFVLAGIVTTEAISRRVTAASKAPVLIALGIVIVVGVCCCSSDAILSRLSQAEDLRSRESSTGARVHILSDLAGEVRQFPLWGTGLGTFKMVFPAFSRSGTSFIAAYAENEFAQLLTACGVVGLALAIWFIYLVGRSYRAAISQPERSIQFAAFGLGFGVFAILVQSFSDYGQHALANAIFTAASCGLLVSVGRLSVPWNAGERRDLTRQIEPAEVGRRPLQMPLPARLLVAVVLVLWGIWNVLAADRTRIAEAAWAQAHDRALGLEDAHWAGSDADYRSLLNSAGLAVEAQPGNAQYRYWLNVFRLHATFRGAEHRVDLQLNGVQQQRLERLLADFQASRPLCPSFGLPLCIAGQIEVMFSRGRAGEDELRTAGRLAPYDPTTSLALGSLALRNQHWPESVQAFERYLLLGGSSEQVTEMYLRANRPQLAFDVARGNRAALRNLARKLRTMPNGGALAARCERDAALLLEAEATQPDAAPQLIVELADFDRGNGRPALAAVLYRRALAFDFGQTAWRLRLAEALTAAGKRSEAVRELQLCLRMKPQFLGAQTLLSELGAQPQ